MALTFDLVVPENQLVSKEVNLVVVPGEQGDFGIMADHAPMIATLKPGVIDVCEKGEEIAEKLFVAGGFAEVTAGRCTVLATEAVNVNDIKKTDADKRVSEAQKQLEKASSEGEIKHAESALEIAQAFLKATS